MRAFVMASLLLAATAATAAPGPTISRQEAIDRARAAGFTLVSKTEPAPNGWDIWASKDGVPYEVRIDAQTGAVTLLTSVEADD